MAGENDPRVERTLRYSICDGIGYAAMVGAGETYLIPYAIFLGTSNFILGLLVALPMCLGSLSQVFSEGLRERLGSRKRLIAFGAACQGLSFIPLLLVWMAPTEQRSLLMLASASLYWIAGLILGPSWSSLMGDLVEEDHRGEYFGRRNRFVQITVFASLVAAGLILYFFKRSGHEYAGYVAIFGLSLSARMVSCAFLLLHWEPPLASPPHARSLALVRETLRDPRYQILILYLSVMNFAVYLSAPFFSTYMLRPPEAHGLNWSYARFTAINGIAMIFKFLFLPLWGKAVDRFGARKCMILAAWIVAALPLFWLFPAEHATAHLWTICFVQALGGFAWAGHELCSFNILLDSAVAADRPRLVASMNIVNGVMIFLGSSVGALIVYFLPRAAGGLQPFLGVFLLSAVARQLVCLTLLPRLREVRQVEAISYRSLFFRVSGVRSSLGPGLRFFLIPAKRSTPGGGGTSGR